MRSLLHAWRPSLRKLVSLTFKNVMPNRFRVRDNSNVIWVEDRASQKAKEQGVRGDSEAEFTQPRCTDGAPSTEKTTESPLAAEESNSRVLR